ncbi:putative transmembrane protein [Toxoplasma gondii TgCatPRC2]|uniref:Transmembrane protein n=3 Tax=Toxoplasma gondii TaxID=5811 RepID=S8G9C5_TOXGM|nr:hypothetical protein TGME49_269340 [Toxoplasma gondii ME49]EPT28325.1 hypothetical protein TGME49_269340 [Toxoplasma gondii ME49]KYF38409.1 hypothetical protein TGARI_269340 [Toxoplasma gondii ARI]KYK70916.1 putative transmembrane protein [Toxoplasma gondii TgCatPRC2]|eukprot:XP_002365625.1 hypothetical protein TGME49_269340 [Toxoplasma gondii ME49]
MPNMDATYTSRNFGNFGHGISMPFNQQQIRYCSSSVKDPSVTNDSHPSAALLEAGEVCSGRTEVSTRIRKTAYSQNGPRVTEYEEQNYRAEMKARCRSLSADPAAVFEQIRQATRVWVTIAACLLLLFVAGSTAWHWNWSSSPVPASEAPISGRSSSYGGEAYPDARNIGPRTAPRNSGRGTVTHSALHAALEKRIHLRQEEPHYVHHEKEEFEEDIMKQHPDDHSFVDIWDGDEHDDLHLSRGVPGLQTPLYRLPFVEGQHNETHAVGVHTSALDVPKRLLVDGGQHLQKVIGGDYDMLVTRDGRPKPLLVHGRLVWKKWAETTVAGRPPEAMFLFYDHTHHTWVFNRDLNFKRPVPVAFLPHGALLPVIRQKSHGSSVATTDTTDTATMSTRTRLLEYLKHGVPKGVHWVVRGIPGDTGSGGTWSGGPTVDATIRVRGHPEHTAPEDFFGLSLQKVFHVPEEGSNDVDEEDNVEDDEYLEEEDSHDHGIHGEYEDEEEEELEKMFVPEGIRTRQQYLTHPQTHVYHTFDEMHSNFDHEQIVEDPVAYLEASGHPDVDTIEREIGDDTTAVPHPLR